MSDNESASVMPVQLLHVNVNNFKSTALLSSSRVENSTHSEFADSALILLQLYKEINAKLYS